MLFLISLEMKILRKQNRKGKFIQRKEVGKFTSHLHVQDNKKFFINCSFNVPIPNNNNNSFGSIDQIFYKENKKNKKTTKLINFTELYNYKFHKV